MLLREDINFLLTNRLPRQLLTRFMGWFSQIEHPLVRDISIGIWKRFAALDLSDARQSHFRSLHDCFTRQLRAGARPLDNNPDSLISPCDGIVGACGAISGTQVIQAKGFPYALPDLLHDPALVEYYRDGTYVTLRLTSSMYHRFHAPCDCQVDRVTYISGDTWNVNPIALKRVEKLFCKNERVLIETTLTGSGNRITLVPVAAILVASVRLLFLDTLLHLRYRGPNVIPCRAIFSRGDEMGWFQHGSTIIVFAPKGFALCAGIAAGQHVRMGEALLRVPPSSPQ
ncbi:MAG TPA: archaetidylserine decarboxylase [Candidatus Propionivibrio aalborgensis]|nr:archaetidylserine decarboxylase [Candidatus Propionivibrio aalborgensis]